MLKSVANFIRNLRINVSSPQKRAILLKSYKYGKGLSIGNNCEIHGKINWGSEPWLIRIGDHVRITDGCKFVTHDGGAWVLRLDKKYSDITLFGKINIKNNVHIGMNTIIMPGVTIGENSIIGCGAVVVKDIPPNSVVVGVPAKVIKTVDEYKNKHENSFLHTKGMTSQELQSYLEIKLSEDKEYASN